MSLLNRTPRQALVDLLMRLPNIGDAAARNLLLTDLPQGLTRTIPFDAAAGTHVANIVNAVNDDAWARLPDGTVPLLLVIENAIYMVQGSGLAAQLQTLHDAVQAAPAPPGGGGPAPPGAPPDPPPAPAPPGKTTPATPPCWPSPRRRGCLPRRYPAASVVPRFPGRAS